MKKLVIGDKVEWLDSYSFMNCKSLIYVDYKGTSVLTTIGSKAFSHCENLKFIFIPISVTSIGSYCFEYDIKCWVVFQRLNNNGITLGTKWNGYNDNYLFIVQIDHSIYSSKWDCDYAYYNEKENKIEYRQGNTIGNFPAE